MLLTESRLKESKIKLLGIPRQLNFLIRLSSLGVFINRAFTFLR